MSTYRVELTATAARQLRKLDPPIRRRMIAALAELEHDPRPPGCKRLVGAPNAWRHRSGDYRILYEIEDDRVLVLVFRIAHRREAYDA